MFYNEAFSYYEKAKDVLGSRKSNAELWDLVNWELSTATFTLAKQLQDYSSADEVSFSKTFFYSELLIICVKLIINFIKLNMVGSFLLYCSFRFAAMIWRKRFWIFYKNL